MPYYYLRLFIQHTPALFAKFIINDVFDEREQLSEDAFSLRGTKVT